MKGTVHPRRLLLCLVLVPALLAGLGAWQSWRAEQQAERLGAAQQRVERALAEARALPPRASVRVDGRAYVRDLALARLDERLADTRSAQRLNRFAAVLADSGACLAALVAVLGACSCGSSWADACCPACSSPRSACSPWPWPVPERSRSSGYGGSARFRSAKDALN
ncbi:hypothetical protein ACG3RS_34595 [Pseudomonas aeruginosa]|uniref:hypothetical protein n=1 Tax=Pseudomonas aeruginosa TaxID=287 RepID=UPI003747E908